MSKHLKDWEDGKDCFVIISFREPEMITHNDADYQGVEGVYQDLQAAKEYLEKELEKSAYVIGRYEFVWADFKAKRLECTFAWIGDNAGKPDFIIVPSKIR